MKRLAFVIISAAVVALGACNKGSEDTVQNAELNQPAPEQLNDLANQAAMDAASRVEMSGCALPVLQQELENLALVM